MNYNQEKCTANDFLNYMHVLSKYFWMTAWMMSARLWYVLLEITIALIGALKVYLLCNLGNYGRPTNQQTDLRVHREVTLQIITIILWFKKICIFYHQRPHFVDCNHSSNFSSKNIFSEANNFLLRAVSILLCYVLWMHLWIWLENVEIIVIRLLWKTFSLSFSEYKVLKLTVDFVNILTVIKFTRIGNKVCKIHLYIQQCIMLDDSCH